MEKADAMLEGRGASGWQWLMQCTLWRVGVPVADYRFGGRRSSMHLGGRILRRILILNVGYGIWDAIGSPLFQGRDRKKEKKKKKSW